MLKATSSLPRLSSVLTTPLARRRQQQLRRIVCLVALMEEEVEGHTPHPPPNINTKVYSHYDHTDACKSLRWTARESFQFMYSRPWHEVVDFYANLVRGELSLLDLVGTRSHFVHCDNDYEHDDSDRAPEESELEIPVKGVTNGERKSGRWARATFKIVLSYNGGSFDGWQRQPGLNTVQGLVEKSLGRFIDEKKAQLLKDKSKPLEGCAVVAGRTDKGVSALRQVCSFYTWRNDVQPVDIEDAINAAEPGKIRVVSVHKVSRAFHPNFSAKWRRYLYIFPLNAGENTDHGFQSEDDIGTYSPAEYFCEPREECGEILHDEDGENLVVIDEEKLEGARKPRSFSVCRVNKLLQQLEGKLLSYKMFARDTKASRNEGPPTECFIYHARAKEVRLKQPDAGDGRRVMCIELVGNRFLRKSLCHIFGLPSYSLKSIDRDFNSLWQKYSRMVRVLVATLVREAAAGAEEDALLKLMHATCRRATAPPAPPDGLCLVDVGYTDFDHRNCLIP